MELFSKSKFEEVINEFAETNDWEVIWGEDGAQIDFEAESGNILTLYITENEEVIEFAVPSEIVYAAEKEVPHDVAIALLKRNAELSVGAWALEEIEHQWYCSMLYNEDLESLDNMDYDELASRLITLVEETDEFNRLGL